MATVGEAIAATLIAQWNVGTGGTQPDPIQYLVERPERDPNPTVADAIYVWLPLRRTFDPIDVAEVYRNVTYTLRIVCHTKTSSARQLEIENEVDRILSSGTVITGATRQRVKEINDISNRSYSNLPKYISEVIMEVFTAMEVSATAYGTATTTMLTTDILTVNTHITGLGLTITQFLDEDNMASDSAAAFASQQSIKKYVDDVVLSDLDTTLTGAYLEDLLMFGSANAAYVPCTLMGAEDAADIRISASIVLNIDAEDIELSYSLPVPCNKGGLKLHISNLKYGLFGADADDYLTRVRIYGWNGHVRTQLDDDGTNHTSAGDKTFSGAIMPAAAIDCSGYQSIAVYAQAFNTGVQHFAIGNVRMECYYAA